MIDASQIGGPMEAVGSDGQHVGMVDMLSMPASAATEQGKAVQG